MKKIAVAGIFTVALALAPSFQAMAQQPANHAMPAGMKMEHTMPNGMKMNNSDMKSTKVIALNNKTCPVSGEPIPKEGGKQIVYNGYKINMCCPDCEAAFKKHPKKYMKDLIKDYRAKNKSNQKQTTGTLKVIGNAKCPVSGEAVGSMAKGAHVDYKGYRVGLCCNGCAKKFKANGDAYLQAMLAEKKP